MCCFLLHVCSAKSKIKMYKILILQQPTANIATVFFFFFSFFLLFYDHQPHRWGEKNYRGRWENPQNELFMDPIVIFVATIVNSLASDYTISK